MGVVVKETRGKSNFKPVPSGTHAAVCTQIVEIGPQETPWGDKDKIKVRFEIPDERVEWEDQDGNRQEGPSIIWATYTASLSEKSNLRKDLEAWRGKSFTKDELNGFDLDAILGAPCMLSVVHREKDDRTYANISSISKLPKSMEAPKAEGELVSFVFNDHTPEQFDALPEWLQDRVREGQRLFQAQCDAEGPSAYPDQDNTDEPPPFDDSDIPFAVLLPAILAGSGFVSAALSSGIV